MEKLGLDDSEYASRDSEELSNKEKANNMFATGADDAESWASQDSKYRMISLYYLDPNDAVSAHTEFKQMEGMEDSDVRITTVSLAKALRSSANLGKGLLTGQPINPHKGTILPSKEGGSLRHKIMPPKKQLYYAARCFGKERVGLFSHSKDNSMKNTKDDPDRDHAIRAVLGNSALGYHSLQRQQVVRDMNRIGGIKPKDELEASYKHMDGHLGIPVFFLPGMERRKSRIKSLVSGGSRKEIPLFFNYEDLEKAWQKNASPLRREG